MKLESTIHEAVLLRKSESPTDFVERSDGQWNEGTLSMEELFDVCGLAEPVKCLKPI